MFELDRFDVFIHIWRLWNYLACNAGNFRKKIFKSGKGFSIGKRTHLSTKTIWIQCLLHLYAPLLHMPDSITISGFSMCFHGFSKFKLASLQYEWVFLTFIFLFSLNFYVSNIEDNVHHRLEDAFQCFEWFLWAWMGMLGLVLVYFVCFVE